MDWVILVGDTWLNALTALLQLPDSKVAATVTLLILSAFSDHVWLE